MSKSLIVFTSIFAVIFGAEIGLFAYAIHDVQTYRGHLPLSASKPTLESCEAEYGGKGRRIGLIGEYSEHPRCAISFCIQDFGVNLDHVGQPVKVGFTVCD